MTSEISVPFSPKHHALLFAWISEAVYERVEEKRAEAVIRKAVRRYGEERGRRMALRARADGYQLSMVNYLAYGEWRAEPGQQIQEIISKVPNLVTHVHKCPWEEAWAESDGLHYGRLYCQEVDEALVRGFNPDLHIDVNVTKSEGKEHCEFVFHDANLGMINTILLGYRRSIKPAESAVMPWNYHLGHLFKTMSAVIVEEFGELGAAAMNVALKNFTEIFGEDSGEAIKSYTGTDFSQLPG
jgi:hypothetical protein